VTKLHFYKDSDFFLISHYCPHVFIRKIVLIKNFRKGIFLVLSEFLSHDQLLGKLVKILFSKFLIGWSFRKQS